MQGKLFQRCTHLLYCNVLSLGGNVNTRRMSKSYMGSIFHITNQRNILVIGNYYVKDGSHAKQWHPSCVYNTAQRHYYVQYKRCVHLWNNFPCISYVNYQNFLNSMLLFSSDTKRTLMHLFLLQIPPRENWFQYVRRVYATAINFHCIITLNEAVKTTQNSKIVNIRKQTVWIPYNRLWSLIPCG